MNRIYLDTAAAACSREEARLGLQQLLGISASLHHEGRAAFPEAVQAAPTAAMGGRHC